MFLTEFFGFFSLSAFTMWGFLMAFFFNVFVYSLNVKRDTNLLFSSFVMMVSYTLSDYFFTWLSIKTTVYLDWAIYDVLTILILSLSLACKKKTSVSFIYLTVGLSINLTFFLLMYFDLYVHQNKERWLLWDIYAVSVNIIDVIMIVALIVDRDFLGLNKLKNKTLSYFKLNNTHKVT